jgi:hypothetical protein
MAGMMAPTCQWCLDSLLSFELSVLLSPSRSMQFLELVPSPGLAFAPSLLLLLLTLLLRLLLLLSLESLLPPPRTSSSSLPFPPPTLTLLHQYASNLFPPGPASIRHLTPSIPPRRPNCPSQCLPISLQLQRILLFLP